VNLHDFGKFIFPFATVGAMCWTLAQDAHTAEPFQIKGLRIGQGVAESCGTAQIETKLDDAVKKLQDSVKGLTPTNTSTCVVNVDSFAGAKVPDGITLLFASDKLIQALFSLEVLTIPRPWDVLVTLSDIYGKPKTDTTFLKSVGWTIHTWVQSPQRLRVNRQKYGADAEVLEVSLEDTRQVTQYQKIIDVNSRLIDESIKRDRARDTR
jgi:hypothetical protein